MTRCVFAALVLVACGGPPAETAQAVAKQSWPQSSAADEYFPLIEGNIYHYVTEENGEPGMLVAIVKRADATHGSLRIGNNEKRFVYNASGVTYEGGAHVLKLPLAVGSRWPGEHGGETLIQAADLRLTVPAGTYAKCIETRETANEVSYVNGYCPGVGLVRMEVQSARGNASAVLQRYGEPVRIE